MSVWWLWQEVVSNILHYHFQLLRYTQTQATLVGVCVCVCVKVTSLHKGVAVHPLSNWPAGYIAGKYVRHLNTHVKGDINVWVQEPVTWVHCSRNARVTAVWGRPCLLR